MFFTTKKNIKIAGKFYRPCVCYELPQFLLTTVKDLAEKGVASITEEPVFFQNGSKIDAEELDRKHKEAKKLERELKKEARKNKKALNQENKKSEESFAEKTEISFAEDIDETEGF